MNATTDIELRIRRQQDGNYSADLYLHQRASATVAELASQALAPLDSQALLALRLDPAAYGRSLSAMLFAAPELRQAWAQARAYADAHAAALRVRVSLDRSTAALHAICWECLHDPLTDEPLALSECVILSRALSSPDLTPLLLPARADLRALVVVASPQNLAHFGLAPIDVAAEVARAAQALAPIPTTIIGDYPGAVASRATLPVIVEQLRDAPHILYLVCHGSLVGGTAYLWLEQRDGTSDQVPGAELVARIQGLRQRPLLVAFASACLRPRRRIPMSDQSSPDLTAVGDPQIESLLAPLITSWLGGLGLLEAYDDPRAHQGGQAFPQQLARALGVGVDDAPALQAAIAAQASAYLAAQAITLSEAQQAQLGARLRDELLGLGILDPLVNDRGISEIMVNGPGQIYTERRGRLQLHPATFADADQLMRVIQRMLAPLGAAVDQRSPRSEVRLPDGAQLTVVIPPLALNGPCLTLRRFPTDALTIQDLIRFGSLTPEMVELLTACIVARLNIIVAGGTGSGKTTLFNVLSGFIPADERIVTVEAVAAYHVRHPHVVTLQSRLPDSHGEGGVSVRDLLRTAARMRPERILVGELQGPEVFDTLQLNTRGHDGSMTTIHANSSAQTMEQLEMMIKLDQPQFPVVYLRAFLGMAVDLIVQQSRLHDGQRKVTAITEVVPSPERGYELREIFAFRETGRNERGKIVGEFVQVNPISPARGQRLLDTNAFLPPSVMAQVLPPPD